MAFIALKNLQNSRICHALMQLAKKAGAVLVWDIRPFAAGP
jgi:hypothetical protein